MCAMAEYKLSEVKKAVEGHFQKAAELSCYLREHPELPDQEFESSRRMVEVLEDAGFEVTYPYAGYETAFHALFDNGDGPEVAILTEYDALPEIGHGCGHNLHGSLSVLTGLALKDLKDCYKGKVHVIGTPAEEENGAKIGMAAQGVFDNMSLAMMMHSWSGGKCRADMDALSLRCYFVEFYGQAAHAVAAPWEGKSALAAARKFMDLIDARRECFTPDVHVNSIVVEGGKAPNIIPDYVKLRMEFRTATMKSMGAVDEMVKKCADGAAMALDCTVKFTTVFEFADMVRNMTLEEEVIDRFESFGMPTTGVEAASGSSDVGNVSYHCPAIQPLLAITDEDYALHTEAFRDATALPQAEKAMENGACILSLMALKIFNDEEFRNKVYAEFQEQVEKRK